MYLLLQLFFFIKNSGGKETISVGNEKLFYVREKPKPHAYTDTDAHKNKRKKNDQ